MSFVFILTVPKESLGPQRKILSFYKVLSANSELKHFLDNCNYFLSTSLLAVYADRNNLKIINDRYGHEEGDFSIRLVGQFLQDSIGKRGVCGRIGGNEFACLVPCSDETMSRDLYRTLHSAFDIFNRTSEKAYNITVSTGFYLLPKDMDSTLPEMLAHADAMLYEEKQKRDKNVAKILPK